MKRTQTTYRADLPVQLRSYPPNKLPDPAETINSIIHANDPNSPDPRGRPMISNGASWDALALVADLDIIDRRIERLEARPTEIIQPTITDKGEAIQKLRQLVEDMQGRISFLEQSRPQAAVGPSPSPPQIAHDVQDALGRMIALQERVEAIEARPAPAVSDAVDWTPIDEVRARLEALEARPAVEYVDAPDTRPRRMDLPDLPAPRVIRTVAPEQVAELAERLAALESRPAGPAGEPVVTPDAGEQPFAILAAEAGAARDAIVQGKPLTWVIKHEAALMALNGNSASVALLKGEADARGIKVDDLARQIVERYRRMSRLLLAIETHEQEARLKMEAAITGEDRQAALDYALAEIDGIMREWTHAAGH